LSIADEADTHVSLSYRSASFNRAKEKNRNRVEQAEASGKLNVLLSSNVQEIFNDEVEIEHEEKRVKLKNDAVIVCAGGILPTPFLKKLGISVEMKYGTE